MRQLVTLDERLSERISSPADTLSWRIAAKIAHTGDGILIFGAMAIVYLAGWVFKLPPLRTGIIFTLLAIMLAGIITMSIKYTLKRERPRDPTGFISIKYDKYSFPSGHSTRMSALAGGVLLFNAPIGVALTALALLVAAARVILGIHYLGDVLVGLSIGFGTAAAIGIFVI